MRVSHMTAVAVAAIVCISSQANAQDPTRRYLSIAQAKYSICTMIAETAAITGVMEKLDECAYEMVDRDIRPMFADAAASLAKNKKALELLKEHMAITSSAFSALQPSSGEGHRLQTQDC